MSFYRMYEYPNRKKRYRHLYFKRDLSILPDRASENSKSILDKLKEDEKRLENLARARRTVRDLILCNRFDYFCTFTFDKEKIDRHNYKECKRKLARFFDNYRQRLSPSFRYLVVPEFHVDGAVHFHGMVHGIRELDLFVNEHGYLDWKQYRDAFGFFSCSKVLHYEACAAYVSKYITKDMITVGKGQRLFMASAKLHRPELVFDAEGIPMFAQPDYENDFVKIKDSTKHFGLLSDWYDECCSELNETEELPEREEEIFERLTGVQLTMYDKRDRFSEMQSGVV